MTITLIICLTILFVQWRSHEHALEMKSYTDIVNHIEKRVSALEQQKQDGFDKPAFEDLKSKVEALRLAQGLKVTR